MSRKKRAPIEKLRYVKQFADEYLASKNLILPNDKSAIARLFNEKDAPILPGVPAYLPYPWTIHATRKALYALTREWEFITRDSVRKQNDNITDFFRFVISGLEREDSKVRELMLQSALTQTYDLQLLHKKGAVAGIAKFLVDSFAVAVVEKASHDVPEYIEWFMVWTNSLLAQWAPKHRQIDGKTTLQKGTS